MIRSMLPTGFFAPPVRVRPSLEPKARGVQKKQKLYNFLQLKVSKGHQSHLAVRWHSVAWERSSEPLHNFRKMCECIFSQSEATVFSLPAYRYSLSLTLTHSLTHSLTLSHTHTRTNKQTHTPHTKRQTQTHARTHSFYLSLKHKISLELTLYVANWLLYLFIKLLRLQVSA